MHADEVGTACAAALRGTQHPVQAGELGNLAARCATDTPQWTHWRGAAVARQMGHKCRLGQTSWRQRSKPVEFCRVVRVSYHKLRATSVLDDHGGYFVRVTLQKAELATAIPATGVPTAASFTPLQLTPYSCVVDVFLGAPAMFVIKRSMLSHRLTLQPHMCMFWYDPAEPPGKYHNCKLVEVRVTTYTHLGNGVSHMKRQQQPSRVLPSWVQKEQAVLLLPPAQGSNYTQTQDSYEEQVQCRIFNLTQDDIQKDVWDSPWNSVKVDWYDEAGQRNNQVPEEQCWVSPWELIPEDDRHFQEQLAASRRPEDWLLDPTAVQQLMVEPPRNGFCAVCHEGPAANRPVKFCKGPCGRGFHRECAALDASENNLRTSGRGFAHEAGRCWQCINNCHTCVVCGQGNTPRDTAVQEDVFKCSFCVPCGRHYHLSCLEQLAVLGLKHVRATDPRSFVCPAHFCSTCGEFGYTPDVLVYSLPGTTLLPDRPRACKHDHPPGRHSSSVNQQGAQHAANAGAQLRACCWCPRAYHAACMPEDARMVQNTDHLCECKTCRHVYDRVWARQTGALQQLSRQQQPQPRRPYELSATMFRQREQACRNALLVPSLAAVAQQELQEWRQCAAHLASPEIESLPPVPNPHAYHRATAARTVTRVQGPTHNRAVVERLAHPVVRKQSLGTGLAAALQRLNLRPPQEGLPRTTGAGVARMMMQPPEGQTDATRHSDAATSLHPATSASQLVTGSSSTAPPSSTLANIDVPAPHPRTMAANPVSTPAVFCAPVAVPPPAHAHAAELLAAADQAVTARAGADATQAPCTIEADPSPPSPARVPKRRLGGAPASAADAVTSGTGAGLEAGSGSSRSLRTTTPAPDLLGMHQQSPPVQPAMTAAQPSLSADKQLSSADVQHHGACAAHAKRHKQDTGGTRRTEDRSEPAMPAAITAQSNADMHAKQLPEADPACVPAAGISTAPTPAARTGAGAAGTTQCRHVKFAALLGALARGAVGSAQATAPPEHLHAGHDVHQVPEGRLLSHPRTSQLAPSSTATEAAQLQLPQQAHPATQVQQPGSVQEDQGRVQTFNVEAEAPQCKQSYGYIASQHRPAALPAAAQHPDTAQPIAGLPRVAHQCPAASMHNKRAPSPHTAPRLVHEQTSGKQQQQQLSQSDGVGLMAPGHVAAAVALASKPLADDGGQQRTLPAVVPRSITSSLVITLAKPHEQPVQDNDQRPTHLTKPREVEAAPQTAREDAGRAGVMVFDLTIDDDKADDDTYAGMPALGMADSGTGAVHATDGMDIIDLTEA